MHLFHIPQCSIQEQVICELVQSGPASLLTNRKNDEINRINGYYRTYWSRYNPTRYRGGISFNQSVEIQSGNIERQYNDTMYMIVMTKESLEHSSWLYVYIYIYVYIYMCV